MTPVKLIPLPPAPNGELSEHVYRNCHFCGKQTKLYPINCKINQRLSGHDRFFCNFCLSNDYQTKNNRNVLIMSFRGILGYYFHQCFDVPHRRMWLSEIKDYEHAHVQAGIQNPLFKYDPESLLWFVDFAKVGKTKKKIKVEEVLKTVLNILSCFNLFQVPELRLYKFFNKYKEAITNFHNHRFRPANKRILVPTFIHCGLGDLKYLEEIRRFTFENT